LIWYGSTTEGKKGEGERKQLSKKKRTCWGGIVRNCLRRKAQSSRGIRQWLEDHSGGMVSGKEQVEEKGFKYNEVKGPWYVRGVGSKEEVRKPKISGERSNRMFKDTGHGVIMGDL